MNELQILGIIGAAAAMLTLVTFVGVQGLNRRRARLRARLNGQEETDSTPEMVLGGLTPALSEQMPVPQSSRQELEQELRAAGFYRPTALMEYLAVRAVLVFVPLLAALAVALVVERTYMPVVALGGLIVAALGFSLPRVWINARARKRARQIERGLPVAVDLLTLGLSGGQNILSSFRRVSREIRFSYPVVSQELEIVSKQADLRSLQHALQQLADRVRVPEVRTLALILVQSERLGTDISTALLEFSSNYRTTMKQRAEAQANRASFWMVFPTIFCLWLPAAVLLAGPVFYEFWHRRDQAREVIKDRMAPKDVNKKRGNLGPGARPGSTSQGAPGGPDPTTAVP